MNTLTQFFVFRWVIGLKKSYTRYKRKKRAEYLERRWEMKLKGLRR